MNITLYNTLSRKEEVFTPLDRNNVRMYVCGPTVYDNPHIGNARAVIVYDCLYRLLQGTYGEDHVIYVRNITDVDDKIIAASKEKGEEVATLTERITHIFHEDMAALHALPPTIEPKATEHIGDMVTLIEKLIAGGHAYESAGHVYFDVASDKGYGQLAGRAVEEMVAGARVEVSENKKNPADFVLWKPAGSGDSPSSVFDSPWGKGRPGWHIECSAMSMRYLGADFDIHGGGADLMFPHHTNEIAQSCCAEKDSHFARYWVHNGFLTVNGEKMSKSLGNFITVRELLDKGVKGEVIRYVLLATHYRKPLDFSAKALDDAKKALDSFYRALEKTVASDNVLIPDGFTKALQHDLNTPQAFAFMHGLVRDINKCDSELETVRLVSQLQACGRFLGLLALSSQEWFNNTGGDGAIDARVAARSQAKKDKNWAEADSIRKELAEQGVILEDKPDGTTVWRKE